MVQVQDYEVAVGSSFDVNHADSYKAVYFVEPVSQNPSYHVTRNIIVKESPTEIQTERSSDSGGNSGQTGESESEEDSEPHSEIQSETEVTEPETV